MSQAVIMPAEEDLLGRQKIEESTQRFPNYQ